MVDCLYVLLCVALPTWLTVDCCDSQELQLAGINFKAFDLGGHEIARRVWKDYYAKVESMCPRLF